jgi:phytoene synthase
MVDDIADAEPPLKERDSLLESLAVAILEGDTSHQIVRPLASLLARFPETRHPLAALTRACRRDCHTLSLQDESELETYAFGVAGNVGLLMYPLLGGVEPEGERFAADLGIAMQLTNIARDVIEDLSRGRVYLPSEWLANRDIRQMAFEDVRADGVVIEAVRRIVQLAHDRYARGLSGLRYLAPENRFAIQVAARCYAAIGEGVIQGDQLAPGRVIVPLSKKISLACGLKFFPSRAVSQSVPCG